MAAKIRCDEPKMAKRGVAELVLEGEPACRMPCRKTMPDPASAPASLQDSCSPSAVSTMLLVMRPSLPVRPTLLASACKAPWHCPSGSRRPRPASVHGAGRGPGCPNPSAGSRSPKSRRSGPTSRISRRSKPCSGGSSIGWVVRRTWCSRCSDGGRRRSGSSPRNRAQIRSSRARNAGSQPMPPSIRTIRRPGRASSHPRRSGSSSSPASRRCWSCDPRHNRTASRRR